MKILVTGGAGFIGSHIVDAYVKLGHEIVVIDNLSTGLEANLNPSAKFYQIDINDESVRDIFEIEKFDLVNHQAAQIDVRVSVGAPRFDAMTNVIGSLNIYESAMATGVKKIIFASSGGAIYGEQYNFPALENDFLRPCSPYGISKLVNEKYLYYYKEVHGIDYAALRYANVYGPRQNFRGEAGVVAIFIQKMLTGQQPFINGDGLNSRDYVFIADVIKANILALGENFSGIFNIGTGVEKDVNFIFNALKSLIGSDCPEIHTEAKSGEQRRSVISFEKIQKMHGWKPDYNIEEGLRLTVESFRRSAK
jgi:UDP-glucose 4-epimerase